MDYDKAETGDATPPKGDSEGTRTRPLPLDDIERQIEDERNLLKGEAETLDSVRENLQKQQELLQEARKQLGGESGA